MIDYKLRQRVVLKDGGAKGAIVGAATEVTDDDRVIMMVVVKLDEGFYNPEKTGYIRMLVVHPENMDPEEK